MNGSLYKAQICQSWCYNQTVNLNCLILSVQYLFQKLVILYDKILRTLQRIPEDAAYRKHTENIIKDRLALVKTVRIDIIGFSTT